MPSARSRARARSTSPRRSCSFSRPGSRSTSSTTRARSRQRSSISRGARASPQPERPSVVPRRSPPPLLEPAVRNRPSALAIARPWLRSRCEVGGVLLCGRRLPPRLLLAAPAAAGGWLPHAADATWTYQWTDSVYNTTPTNEASRSRARPARASCSPGRPTAQDNTPTRRRAPAPCRSRTRTSASSTPTGRARRRRRRSPCSARRSRQCGNSLASTYYNVIWGARAPVLAEPLLARH